MGKALIEYLQKELENIKEQGLFKQERQISSPQQANITLKDGKKVLNLCANNYLGLSNHPALVATAQKAIAEYGFGLSSVRFICGTQTLHKELERKISSFLQMEDTILYSSCFDANTGLFETILSKEDAIISDSLNHASVIDGIRLCKAKRFVYNNSNMQELEEKLKEAQDCRFRLIATDGVFSMDGTLAKLNEICDLADKYDALVMVDDSHAVGFCGANGRGTQEQLNVMARIDIITGTLGKALGGASGGYTSAKKEIVEFLRQRSRPYLFSNSLAPVITATSIKAIDLIENNPELRNKLRDNSEYFRNGLNKLGFNLLGGNHPIIPVMLGDAVLANKMANELLEHGIYVIGFSYPVVPKGQARIRTQMSAALNKEDLDFALNSFALCGQKLGII